ncbi:MAG: hypothetical protein OXF33_00010 [Rhodospirillales bacterium]|nr:hypothetical protein [Rhodospirillales bacterium]MCY4002083.1 hypothetical protein [Rhodospirillales bacterium]MCY4097172.1 hypothetical protein [Rhodospirillales bacterium]
MSVPQTFEEMHEAFTDAISQASSVHLTLLLALSTKLIEAGALETRHLSSLARQIRGFADAAGPGEIAAAGLYREYSELLRAMIR